MTERSFRFILGASLLLLLFFQFEMGIYIYIGVLLLEGLSNWRMPLVISKVRYGANYSALDVVSADHAVIPFDAERALRLIVACALIVTFVMFREQVWFFPWFMGFMLFMAGMTNICPMVMFLRWMGFR